MTTTLKQIEQTKAATAGFSNSVSVTDALSDVLTETYRLVLKSHTYHWNVTGPQFFTIHEMTEEQYTDMFAAADVLAERILALGKPAVVDIAALAARADGLATDANMSTKDMVGDLLADHEALAERLRALVGRAEDAGDPVTADLATERAAFHEKAAWMLRAMVS